MVTLYDFTIWNDSDFPVWNSPKNSFPALTYQKTGGIDFFASQRFQETGVETLKEQIAQYEEKLKFHKLPLVRMLKQMNTIIQINRYTPAVGECLRSTFPTMPPGLLEKVVQNGSMSQHVSVIPRARKDNAGLFKLQALEVLVGLTLGLIIDILCCNRILLSDESTMRHTSNSGIFSR
ncbi:hypothetical protein N7528_008165 [Penicillium herquei]|nr:hypothetical protein N7528_008165 [Penicillium herquei]